MKLTDILLAAAALVIALLFFKLALWILSITIRVFFLVAVLVIAYIVYKLLKNVT